MLNKTSYRLHFFEAEGTPYEFGRQLGQFGAPVVHEYLLSSPAWQTVQQWQGSTAARTMADLVRRHYPEIWQELEGLAAGLELPLEQVFLWNARGDLWAMAPDGCTSILTPGAISQRISHNEDGDPGFAGHCAIVQRNINGKAHFASFVYPGSIPGHTLAVNRHGLAMTVNNIRALSVEPGLPRMVLTRAILELKEVASAVELLRRFPRAGAFHLSLADISQQLVSVEFSQFYCSVVGVQSPVLHANHAIHPEARDWPQLITPSSGRRQLRGEHLVQEGKQAPLEVLSDRHNERYPIYRRLKNDVDNENTLATSDMVVNSTEVIWQVYEDPRQAPTYQFRNACKIRD